jgi:hypothetical protein
VLGTLPKDDYKIVSLFARYVIDLTQKASVFGISKGAWLSTIQLGSDPFQTVVPEVSFGK